MSSHDQTSRIASARGWINQNAAVVTVAAVLSLAITLPYIEIPQDSSFHPTPESAWYFVPETNETIVAKATLIPPIDYKGKQAVKAHYYGCDDCSAENEFLGYYEKYSDKAKAELDSMHAVQVAGGKLAPDTEMRAYELAMTERFYSRDGKTWVRAESQEGHAIQEELRDRCGLRKLTYCSS